MSRCAVLSALGTLACATVLATSPARAHPVITITVPANDGDAVPIGTQPEAIVRSLTPPDRVRVILYINGWEQQGVQRFEEIYRAPSPLYWPGEYLLRVQATDQVGSSVRERRFTIVDPAHPGPGSDRKP